MDNIDNAVKEFIKQYKKAFRATFSKNGSNEGKCKNLTITKNDLADDKDNNYHYLKVEYLHDLGVMGIDETFFMKIPYDVLLNTELSFDEKCENIEYEEPEYPTKDRWEWEDELCEEFPKFLEERYKSKGRNFTVTITFHKFIDNDDGETYTLMFYVKRLNNDTGEETEEPFFMHERLLTQPKLTWEEKFTHSKFMLFPRKIEEGRAYWSDCVTRA